MELLECGRHASPVTAPDPQPSAALSQGGARGVYATQDSVPVTDLPHFGGGNLCV